MEKDNEFSEILRRKISEALDEPFEEGIDADDLMFELGMRYLRLRMAEKKNSNGKVTKRFSLWADDAPSKKAIIEYVDSVTDINSPDYIPPFDRIAIFDLDGTIFCETNPTWFDFMLLKHRILEDEKYKIYASEHEKKIAAAIQDVIDTGIVPKGLEVEVGHAIAHAFEGMSIRDFSLYVRKFAEQPSPCFEGMNIGEAFFQPMVQLIYYLKDNGFSVYICSGSDREVIRVLVEGALILPSRYVIGTEERISARNQKDIDGSEYEFDNGDELVLKGEISAKNLKMTKVSMAAQQIGHPPVLSFGNSFGDVSMTNYVMSNPAYKTAAFFVCCDDDVRENGSPEKAQKIYDLCSENGWTPISMKNDWLTIFGEGITKK